MILDTLPAACDCGHICQLHVVVASDPSVAVAAAVISPVVAAAVVASVLSTIIVILMVL